MSTYALRSTQKNMFARRYTILGHLGRTLRHLKGKRDYWYM